MTEYFKATANFIIGANAIEQIPPTSLAEVAFIGRSNVGKSSLINALTGRKSLARVSQNPGCTKQLNFFQIGDLFVLVDLPGYGFARVSKAERGRFNNLVKSYLRGRKQLQRIFLLLDSRHEVKDSDVEMMSFLDDYATTYQLVLTKVDKAPASWVGDLEEKLKKLTVKHAACHPNIIKTSTVSRIGIEDLQNEITDLINL